MAHIEIAKRDKNILSFLCYGSIKKSASIILLLLRLYEGSAKRDKTESAKN